MTGVAWGGPGRARHPASPARPTKPCDALTGVGRYREDGEPSAIAVDDQGVWFTTGMRSVVRLDSARGEIDLTVALPGQGPDLAHCLAEADRRHLECEVPLTGFGPGEVDTMLRAIFGLTRPAPAHLPHLRSMLTKGNPFFIEEVLK